MKPKKPIRSKNPRAALPHAAQTYIRPVLVPHTPGRLIPGRGQLRRIPFQDPKSLQHLRITENPDGTVRVPRYEFNPDTRELERQGTGYAVFPDVNAALRAMGWHIPESVRAETKRMHRLYDALRGFHGITADHWNRLTPRQKNQLIEEIRKSIGFLAQNPELLRSKTKIKALDRISRASELLEQGNYPAALFSLSGAANDALQRFNELIGQRPFLSRRARSLERFKTRREEGIFTGLRAIVGEFGRIGRLSGLARAEQTRFFQTLSSWARYFGAPQRSKIPAFRNAAEHIKSASEFARAGRTARATEELRSASRLIALEISKTSDFYGDLITLVGQSKDAQWKKQILRQQAELVRDNLSYWSTSGFPEGFGDLHSFFDGWSRVAKDTGRTDIAQAFLRAKTDFNLGRISECEKKLGGIAKKLSA